MSSLVYLPYFDDLFFIHEFMIKYKAIPYILEFLINRFYLQKMNNTIIDAEKGSKQSNSFKSPINYTWNDYCISHSVQKLIVIINKLPRTFDSCLSLSDI